MLSRLFKAVLNACMPLKTRRNAFPIVNSNTEVKMYDLLDSFLYLPELASVVEFRMCQRSLFTPSFLPLYKLFTTDLATRGILEIRLAGLRVLEFLLPPPVAPRLLRTQPWELNPGRGDSPEPLLPSRFSCTLLQALHIKPQTD